jgi:type I restriction enzyme S subunit
LYINGVAFEPSDWEPEGRPIVRIQNLSGQSREYHFTQRKVSEDNTVQDGDLLVSWSATIDAFRWAGPPAVVNQHIFKVIPNLEAVSPAFLYWLLKREVRLLAESQHAHGLAMMHINRGPFLAHLVALPPLAEQGLILAKLEEVMGLCDQLEGAQGEREARRDSLRHTVLQELTNPAEATPATLPEIPSFFLTHFADLVALPRHVRDLESAIRDLAVHGQIGSGRGAALPLIPLSELCEKVTDGTHRTPTYLPSGTPFVSVKDFSAGKLDFSNARRISAEEHADLIRRCDPQRGDVLMGRIGTLGKAVVVDVDQPFSLFVSVGLLRPRPDAILPEYLALYLNSPTAEHQYDQIKVGGGTHTNKLNLADLKKLKVPTPGIAEQRIIVNHATALLTLCEGLRADLSDAEGQRLRTLGALVEDAAGGEGVASQVSEAS